MNAQKWILLAVVGAVAFGLGTWISMKKPAGISSMPEREISGYILDEPRLLPPFRLTDQAGEPFTPEDFEGDWSFLYFGYTFCPDVCPASLSVMAQVKDELDLVGVEANDQYYLVSVDPERDTPERLNEYVTYFNEDFRGVSGPTLDLDQFTLAAGVVYQLPEPEERVGDYLVGHSSTITLINPEGRIHAIFTTPLVAADIASDFGVILERYAQGVH